MRGAGGVAFVAAKVPLCGEAAWLRTPASVVTYLNSMGMTAWLDAGGRGMSGAHYEPYRELADRGELNIRVYWTTIRQPATPEQVDKVVADIPSLKPFQGNDYFDNVGYGRVGATRPITTQLLQPDSQHQAGGHRAVGPPRAGAGGAGHLLQHARGDGAEAIDAFLTVYEEINRSGRSRGCAGRSRTSTRSRPRSSSA